MSVGSGLYMYDVVVKRSRLLSHLLMSFCYNIALCNRFRIGLMNKFPSCYIKCAKMFLGFTKYYSVAI